MDAGERTLNLAVRPLRPERWSDFTELFGERGACGGCWCMVWRLSRKQFDLQKGDGNREVMKALVDSGVVPGLLAYDGSQAVGWCAFAPREDYGYLARSRVLKPVDDRRCWSVSCFFIDKAYRNRGVASFLLRAVVDYLKDMGAELVEGYPVERSAERHPPAFIWTGVPSIFENAGFREVARGSATRPIMRLELE